MIVHSVTPRDWAHRLTDKQKQRWTHYLWWRGLGLEQVARLELFDSRVIAVVYHLINGHRHLAGDFDGCDLPWRPNEVCTIEMPLGKVRRWMVAE